MHHLQILAIEKLSTPPSPSWSISLISFLSRRALSLSVLSAFLQHCSQQRFSVLSFRVSWILGLLWLFFLGESMKDRKTESAIPEFQTDQNTGSYSTRSPISLYLLAFTSLADAPLGLLTGRWCSSWATLTRITFSQRRFSQADFTLTWLAKSNCCHKVTGI